MAVNSVINHTYDLETPLVITPLRHALATGDQLGDRFDITVTQKGQPADLTGAGVTGYFIRTADGATVVVTGSASGNVASVTLPESCYVVPGRFTLTVKVSKGDVRHAVYVGEGAVLRSSTDTIIDPGHEIPDLDELLAMISQVESAASAAQAAAQQATTAAGSANTAASSANTAASAANTAKGNADAAAKSANDAATAANASKTAADNAASAANTAASAANTAKTNADAATNAANDAAASANAAATKANASAAAADTAKSNADKATSAANAAAKSIDDMTVSGRDTAPGGAVTVTKSTVDGHIHLSFTIPRGHDGPQGDQGVQGVPGPQGIQGPKGDKGDRGDSGVTVPINGLFILVGDEEGNLWAYYGDTQTPPEFEVDAQHNIYYIVPEV